MQWGELQTYDGGFQTAPTLKGRNGWTLQLILATTASDQTNFQC
jgi:hypothetical protein